MLTLITVPHRLISPTTSKPRRNMGRPLQGRGISCQKQL